jgi:choline dehydrogenase-like flavoprotein
VIVGGGNAGLVLAARLSEDPDIQLAVLEAGEDKSADPRVVTPAMWPTLLKSEVDWDFRSKDQVGKHPVCAMAKTSSTLAVEHKRKGTRYSGGAPSRRDNQHQWLLILSNVKVPCEGVGWTWKRGMGLG